MQPETSKFWTTIESIDQSALERGETSFALRPLIKILESFSIPELEDFEEHLHEVLFAIDGEDFFQFSGETSGDIFLYCRCYVVAKGLLFYNEVLQTPALMPNRDFEPLLYVASQVWASKTGKDESDWDFIPNIESETGCNIERWSAPTSIQLTPEQITEQYEVRYQRALSSVVHAYRKGHFNYVVELLTPFSDRLSKRFMQMLQDAKSKIKPS